MARLKRRHAMPFGAQLLPDGGVRFRLWAPGAAQVDVCLLGDREEVEYLPMNAEEQGWFTLSTARAGAGSLYRLRIDGQMQVPDPASRFQPQDVHGPSEVIDAEVWEWQDSDWQGRPWEEVVIYELHVGSFSPGGDYEGVAHRLDYLVALGVTAIELMPLAHFPGARNWGYDGTYLYAPESRYGRPEDLKALIDAAHARGLMVFLDVVYNHFGPEGNYLAVYAPQFFNPDHHTPWGAAINFDGDRKHWVRQFFIHNALYWLEEYHFDGLRFDAAHAIPDDSTPHILNELAEAVKKNFGASRHIHLVLENDANNAAYLLRDGQGRPRRYVAQWNDDIHHALHVILTGEADGYYADYADTPIHYLGRCLTEGFAYQGECSAYRNGEPRGEPSAQLPATAFVSFLQNHDQVGNRALGERISVLTSDVALHAALALLLLAPSPPLLFMGQEWGSEQPFPFFCDFGADLADQVVEGRRREFARFAQFRDPAQRERIPNPMAVQSFTQAVLDWESKDRAPHAQWLDLHRRLLAVRRRELVPRLSGLKGSQSDYQALGERALRAQWRLGDGTQLGVLANLGTEVLRNVDMPPERRLYATHADLLSGDNTRGLPAWSVLWYLRDKASSA